MLRLLPEGDNIEINVQHCCTLDVLQEHPVQLIFYANARGQKAASQVILTELELVGIYSIYQRLEKKWDQKDAGRHPNPNLSHSRNSEVFQLEDLYPSSLYLC
eukprot:NODE_39_length_35218_cov_0.479655.p38 type:complete len:103 gc:universal NODE_39_length_35218_cov_0.479655:18013-18321(+)